MKIFQENNNLKNEKITIYKNRNIQEQYKLNFLTTILNLEHVECLPFEKAIFQLLKNYLLHLKSFKTSLRK